MASKSIVGKIVRLLADPADDKKIAAAIVLGELALKNPEVRKGLTGLLASQDAVLQRHAIDALTKTGARPVLPLLLPLLSSGNADLQAAATRAALSCGEAVVPMIKDRVANAGPLERRALDSILAQLGGKEAFATLLQSLDQGDADHARRAVLEVRQEVRVADAKKRRDYLTQVTRFIEKRADDAAVVPGVLAAAVKLVGLLEDAKALPLLLRLLKSKSAAPEVRQEAVIALRFALTGAEAPEVLSALMTAADSDDRTLAQTALMTLAGLELSPRLITKFRAWAVHPDIERARFAIDKLAEQEDAASAKVLGELLVTSDRGRFDQALRALEKREDALVPLCEALLVVEDPERAWLIRKAVVGKTQALSPALRKALLQLACDRLAEGHPAWEALLDVARRADGAGALKALRGLVDKLRRARKKDRALAVMQAICSSHQASDDDRYELVSLELALHGKPNAQILNLLSTLVQANYDVAGALRRDRNIGLDELYQLGFDLVERDHPLGEELLNEVVNKAGRKKLGQMAKNKLQLAGYGE